MTNAINDLEDFALEFEPMFSEFVREMRVRLIKNMKAGKSGWDDVDWDIRERIKDELEEGEKQGANPGEYADASNFCFFAWYRKGKYGQSASGRITV